MGPIQSAVNQSLTGSAFMLGLYDRVKKESEFARNKEIADMKAEVSEMDAENQKMITKLKEEKPSDAMKKAKQHLMESINMKQDQRDRSEEFKQALKNKPAGFYTNQQIMQMGGLSK